VSQFPSQDVYSCLLLCTFPESESVGMAVERYRIDVMDLVNVLATEGV